MKKVILTILLALIAFSFLLAQDTIGKEFFGTKYGGPPVNRKKAKVVVVTIKQPDSTLCYEMRDIKDDKLLSLQYFKDDYPVGKWILISGKELDFNFELKYSKTEYTNIVLYNIKEKTTKLPVEGSFEPPIFPLNDNDFQNFVASKIIYPVKASENGIQGKVISQFILDETGKLIELSILNSVEKTIDKEVARVIRLSPQWIPAKVNGKPTRVCIIMPTIFKLQ